MLNTLLAGAWLIAAAPADPAYFAPNATSAAAIPLPEGRLTLVFEFAGSGHFLVRDWTIASGDVVDYWRLVIRRRPSPLPNGGELVQYLDHERINCARRTYELVISRGYSPSGQMVVWLPSEPAAPISGGTVYSALADILCDGARMPEETTVMGAQAARARIAGG